MRDKYNKKLWQANRIQNEIAAVDKKIKQAINLMYRNNSRGLEIPLGDWYSVSEPNTEFIDLNKAERILVGKYLLELFEIQRNELQKQLSELMEV
jgi:hypothetical protein